MDDRQYIRLNILKITTRAFNVHPDWAHISAWDVFVGQMPNAPDRLNDGEPNQNRGSWAPLVLIGDTGSLVGMNPRAARFCARMLLEAADRAEEKEIELGWHPSQDLSHVNKVHNL